MSKKALLVIDMLYDFTDPNGLVYYPQTGKIIDNVATLIEGMRKQGHLIVFVKHTYRKDKFDSNLEGMRPCCIEGSGGNEIDKRLHVDPKDYVIKKRRYSAFYGTDLDLILREQGIKDVVLAGTKTNNCVIATAFDAHYLNYGIEVVKDCVSTNDDAVNAIYLKDIDKYLGNVVSLADMIEGDGHER